MNNKNDLPFIGLLFCHFAVTERPQRGTWRETELLLMFKFHCRRCCCCRQCNTVTKI